jgi:hypothetical protein
LPYRSLNPQPKLRLQVSFSPPPKRRHNRSASRPWFDFTSTTGSEEPALDMSPTVLRRVLPNLGLTSLSPR